VKLTRAEHIARAALLGLYYDPRDGTYCPGSVDEDTGNVWYKARDLLDCLTMEPIDVNVSVARHNPDHGPGDIDPVTEHWPLEDRWELPDEVTNDG
jgi:hypothetical protein